jgi:hypothetical protein
MESFRTALDTANEMWAARASSLALRNERTASRTEGGKIEVIELRFVDVGTKRAQSDCDTRSQKNGSDVFRMANAMGSAPGMMNVSSLKASLCGSRGANRSEYLRDQFDTGK